MNVVPEVVVKAAAGSNVEGKLTLAEAAGIRAIHQEIRQVDHKRRELGMEIQKLGVQWEDLVDALRQAWVELCPLHGFDPNVPVDAWEISKKNRAILNADCHPEKERPLARKSHKPGVAPADPDRTADDGGDGPPEPGRGAPDGGAEDDSGPATPAG